MTTDRSPPAPGELPGGIVLGRRVMQSDGTHGHIIAIQRDDIHGTRFGLQFKNGEVYDDYLVDGELDWAELSPRDGREPERPALPDACPEDEHDFGDATPRDSRWETSICERCGLAADGLIQFGRQSPGRSLDWVCAGCDERYPSTVEPVRLDRWDGKRVCPSCWENDYDQRLGVPEADRDRYVLGCTALFRAAPHKDKEPCGWFARASESNAERYLSHEATERVPTINSDETCPECSRVIRVRLVTMTAYTTLARALPRVDPEDRSLDEPAPADLGNVDLEDRDEHDRPNLRASDLLGDADERVLTPAERAAWKAVTEERREERTERQAEERRERPIRDRLPDEEQFGSPGSQIADVLLSTGEPVEAKAFPALQRRKDLDKLFQADPTAEHESKADETPTWVLVRPSAEDHDPDDPEPLPDAVREALLAAGYAPVDGSDESGELGDGGYPIERRPGSAGDDYAGWFVFCEQ